MEERPRSLLTPAMDPALELSPADVFWEENWRKLALGLAAIVVLILAAGAYMYFAAQQRHAAEALYSAASTPQGWREVVDRYPGSIPAGNARLLLAAGLRSEGKLDEAAAELDTFLSDQPDHPMAGAGWLALGEVRQLQGKPELAVEAYRTASMRHKESYAAPLALLAEARLLSARGSKSEARAVLESIGPLYPNTPSAMMAAAELKAMGVTVPAENPSPAPATP